jgi:hypothetical protein
MPGKLPMPDVLLCLAELPSLSPGCAFTIFAAFLNGFSVAPSSFIHFFPSGS